MISPCQTQTWHVLWCPKREDKDGSTTPGYKELIKENILEFWGHKRVHYAREIKKRLNKRDFRHRSSCTWHVCRRGLWITLAVTSSDRGSSLHFLYEAGLDRTTLHNPGWRVPASLGKRVTISQWCVFHLSWPSLGFALHINDRLSVGRKDPEASTRLLFS